VCKLDLKIVKQIDRSNLFLNKITKCVLLLGHVVVHFVVTYKYRMIIYRINFHLSTYEFKIDLYVNFGEWWNVKFQTK
jgi:hypothetical protein